jgi:iron complex transport system substrate-binding protein
MLKAIVIVLILLALPLSIVSAKDVSRYISLAPATTEILFSLGLNENIVGVSSYCNYPLEAREKDKFGTFSDPNIEKIVSVKPDMVFATGLEQTQTVIRLKRLGVKVFVSDPKDVEGLFDSIIQIGQITGKEKESKALVENMRLRIEAIKGKLKSVAKDKRPRVFIEIWHDPLMTAGPGSIVHEILILAGGENIAYDAPKAYSRFSSEVIIKRNPEVLILGYMSKVNTQELVSKRLGWQGIDAVRNKRIISDIDPDLILRPGPRIVQGLEEIHRHLYEK